jgi:hypothetical protein
MPYDSLWLSAAAPPRAPRTVYDIPPVITPRRRRWWFHRRAH